MVDPAAFGGRARRRGGRAGRVDLAAGPQRRRGRRGGAPAFADDFGGVQGSPLDLTKWNLDGGPDNGVQDGNGNLVVTRLLRTRPSFSQRYGHAEARIEASRASGVWHAFSVLDRYGRMIPGKLQTLRGGIDPTAGDNFHTYTIDWSPRAIVWSVDGHPSLRLLPARPADGIMLVLDLAGDGTSPVRMTIDFVHVSVYGWAGFNPAPSPPSDSASPSPTPTPSETTTVPTTAPTTAPTTVPTTAPTTVPTTAPTTAPTTVPTTAPTTAPAAAPWKAFTNYQAGDLVTYEGATYKVLEAHTSLPGWEPTALPSLFQKVSG